MKQQALYQTQFDMRAELDVGTHIAKHYGYHVQMTEKTCPYDFLIHRGNPKKPIAVVEFKCREVFYDPMKISQWKVDNIRQAARELNCKPVWIIGMKKLRDHYRWVDLDQDFPVGIIQRNRNAHIRGDKAESCYEIPLNAFSYLRGTI